ncbi:MAG: hypothetical protein R6V10_09360 [bacterium]
MTPAELNRDLITSIKKEGLDVEVLLDINWVFLRHKKTDLSDFGDVNKRDSFMGKWIFDCDQEVLLSESKKLLPFIHSGLIKLAKFSNFCNFPKRSQQIVVYCTDHDKNVNEAVKELYWPVRWKYNYQTFKSQE